MHAADRFLKFATECHVMAELSPTRENKRVWDGLAQRWLRCAKMIDNLDNDLKSSASKRRAKHLKVVAH
jgi:hypothetical protein